jgi:hypothetical protein
MYSNTCFINIFICIKDFTFVFMLRFRGFWVILATGYAAVFSRILINNVSRKLHAAWVGKFL